MLKQTPHGAQQSRGTGSFIASLHTLGKQRLQIVALGRRKRELMVMQPGHQHAQIASVGAESIFGKILLKPQRIEKLLDECEILFHVSLFRSAMGALCLNAGCFWYTTRKVIASIETF